MIDNSHGGSASIVAEEFFAFSVYGASKEHIITLRLRREEGMTIGDMAQMQSFLWTLVGKAIRDDPSLVQRLRDGGIEVLIEDPRATASPGVS